MKKIILFTILLLTLTTLPAFVFAQTPQIDLISAGVKESADKADIPTGEGAGDVAGLLGQLINTGFALLGTIVLGFTLVGGLLWMIAGGNEDKVTRAKKFIVGGIEGMIVIFMAYALVYIVINALSQGATRATTGS